MNYEEEEQIYSNRPKLNHLSEWKKYLQDVENNVSLDLCQCSIKEIPNDFLLKCPHLQCLYLEGNELTELNPDIFPLLRHLKWLDLRNNKLTSLPNSLVDHPSLQVLLLDGNNIQRLPVEIGSLKQLRGIQLGANPLVYPPEHIVNQGIPATIDFLQKEWQQLQSPQHIQLISENHSQTKVPLSRTKLSATKKQKPGGCKSAVELKVRSHEPRRAQRAQSGLSAASLSQCIRVRPISQHMQPSKDDKEIFGSVSHAKSSNTCNQQRKTAFPTYSRSYCNTDAEVQPKMLRDLWIEKIRQVLLTQEAIIQRRKSSEALKQWQDETQILQKTQPKRCSEVNFPYGTDEEYLKMLNRKELTVDGVPNRRGSSLHDIKHEEPVNNRILSILKALQDLQTSEPVPSVSPRSEQKSLAQEIKKIKEIQRSLNALKLKNFGQLGISN